MAKLDPTLINQVVTLQHKMPDHMVCDSHADRKKLASDWLDEKRDNDRLDLMQRLLPLDIYAAKMLEIGSGVGTFLIAAHKRSITIDGLEPVLDLVNLSQQRLESINAKNVTAQVGSAEKLPYPDNTYEIVTSFQVLEHVSDPKQVLNESLRVLRPGGYIYFVIPSYQTFWEGHYGIFWWPKLHRFPQLMKLYIRLMQRDPAYVDTLQFITPGFLRETLSASPYKNQIQSLGCQVWEERLSKGMPTWGYTKRLFQVVNIARKLKLLSVVKIFGKHFEFYTPIILVCQKGEH